jgi:hypothetical protein
MEAPQEPLESVSSSSHDSLIVVAFMAGLVLLAGLALGLR